jgi:hypothetical protein
MSRRATELAGLLDKTHGAFYWAETLGACSQTVTMAAACSASVDAWEAKSPSGVGSGFSGGVSLKSSIHWHPAFCGTLPARACPAASKKLDGLCLS